MAWNLTLLIVLLIIGSLLTLLSAIYALRQKTVRGYRVFALAMLLIAWWGGAYSAELLATNPDYKLIFARMQYVALPVMPTMLIFAAISGGYQWQKRWRNVLPLYIIPLLSTIIVWVQQPLIWKTVTTTTIGNTEQLSFNHGPFFFVVVGWSYLLYLITVIIVLRLAFSSPRLTGAQAVLLVLGAITPFCANLLYVLRLPFLRGIDLTPFSLTTFGLVTAWVLFEIRPIDFLPVVYNAAFDSLPDPAMMVGVNNNVRLLNPAGVQQMIKSGRDPVKVRGNSFRYVMPEHWYELVKEPNQHETVTHEVTRNISGRIEYFDMRITPLRDKRNRFKGRLFVIRDITERKYEQLALAEREQVLAQAVKEQTAELQLVNDGLMQAVRMKDEFLAGMSHELRTPLNAVIGTSESIHEGVYGKVPSKLQEPLKRIDQSASHLLELIEDILDMSKIEAGNLELRIEPIKISEICSTCIKLLQGEATKKQIKMQLATDITQQVIAADKRRLRQILFNLLTNAIKFTPDGGQVGLTVTENVEQAVTCFTVWDTGIGIADGDKERIFNSFVQVDSTLARKYDGAGLGLALTRNLVTMHGGDISVVSALDQGSHFTVSLPWNPKL